LEDTLSTDASSTEAVFFKGFIVWC
jgi:hypothetical protein